MKPLRLTTNSLEYVCQELRKLDLNGKAYEVKLSDYSRKRTLSANAQQHVWYKMIHDWLKEQGVELTDLRTVGNSQKLDFGLPILLADDKWSEKIEFVLDKINFWDMTREQKVNVMDLIQVTSLFTTKQHNEYRDNMIMYWEMQGLILEYK